MFTPMRRRPAAAASATPLRRALHAAAVTCSSAVLGASTMLLGANAIEATGIGLAALPVVTTFAPVPPRGSRAGRQIDSGLQGLAPQSVAPVVREEEAPASPPVEGGKVVSAEPDEVTSPPRAAATPPGPGAGDMGGAGSCPVNPAPSDDAGFDAVMIWEPRLQIKPRVTIFPAHVEEAPTVAPAPVQPPVPEADADATPGDES